MDALHQPSLFDSAEEFQQRDLFDFEVEPKVFWEGFVYGIPAGQPRPRSAIKRDSKGNLFVQVYEQRTLPKTKRFPFLRPHPVILWKAAVYREIRVYRTITEPVRIDIDFFMPRPQELMRKKYPDGLIWYDSKPDRDNFDKAVLDALVPEKGMKVLEDDRLAVTGLIQKFYCEKYNGRSGAYIRIAQAGTPRANR